MVGVLISMKFAMLRHSPKGVRRTGWVLGVLLVLSTYAAAVLAADPVRGEVLMLLLAGWGVGAVLGPVTMSGAGVLRADYFTLLPLERSRLALGLLGAVFPGVASGCALLACWTVVVHAALLDPVTVLVALPGGLLAWVVVITLARLVYAALGSAMRSWLGVEISGLQFGLLIGSLLAGWMVVAQTVQTVPQLLAQGLPDVAVRVLAGAPTSWPLRAVEAAATGSWGTAGLWVLALVLLAVGLLGLAAVLLRPHLGGRGARRRRRPLGSRWDSGRLLLPDTELGAVVGKELRQWWRDPWRALELRTAVYTGLVTGLFASLSGDFAAVAPLAGLAVALMVALTACNLYGQDGSALWVTVVNQRAGSVRADVRGRQLALLLLFTPPTVVVSVLLVLLTGAPWAWLVLAAGVPALLGVGAGVAVTVSAVAVSPGVDPRRRTGPNDAGGNMSLQVQVAQWGTVALVLPTVAAVLLGHLVLPSWGPWAAAGVGLLNGLLAFWLLGRAAIDYLTPRLPTLYSRIRYRRDDDETASGALGRLARSSQQSEDKARALKEKEKEERARQRLTENV